jgi:hypothetical protein
MSPVQRPSRCRALHRGRSRHLSQRPRPALVAVQHIDARSCVALERTVDYRARARITRSARPRIHSASRLSATEQSSVGRVGCSHSHSRPNVGAACVKLGVENVFAWIQSIHLLTPSAAEPPLLLPPGVPLFNDK